MLEVRTLKLIFQSQMQVNWGTNNLFKFLNQVSSSDANNDDNIKNEVESHFYSSVTIQ